MDAHGYQQVGGGLPRPGPALRGALLALFSVWLAFAVAINWAGASADLFLLLCGNNALILEGELWRIVTAPFMHQPTSYGSILFALLGLYFLSPSLESAWGPKRFLRFLFLSALIAYGAQLVVAILLPASIAQKLVPQVWFGSLPVIEAIAIAWALSFRGQTVRLMMLVPVSSRTLVLFVVGTSLLAVVALATPDSGLIAPFGGMASGWLLGGGTPSPLRQWWLRRRLSQTKRDLEFEKERRQRRVRASGLRLVQGTGGADSAPAEDSDPPSPGVGGDSGDRGPDGHLLN